MFAGRGSAFVVTTTAMRRGLTCLTETTCSPAAECSACTDVVGAGAANAGTATRVAQAAAAAIRRLMRMPQRSPRLVLILPSTPSSSLAVEPGGDEPVRNRRRGRKQRPARE